MATEKRLIDANALLETGSGIKMIVPVNCHPYEAIRIQGNAFRKAVEEAPTVDAVEVVRCKDCKHWEKETGSCTEHPTYYDHGMDWYIYDEDDFCSCGERKDDEYDPI